MANTRSLGVAPRPSSCLQSDFDAAEYLLQKSLEIREEVLGSGHPDVADSLKSMAGVFYTQVTERERERERWTHRRRQRQRQKQRGVCNHLLLHPPDPRFNSISIANSGS